MSKYFIVVWAKSQVKTKLIYSVVSLGYILTVASEDHLCVFQHWEVFREISEVFILVPALVGLKGNLEMTLASRLSTAVSANKHTDTLISKPHEYEIND